MNFKQTCLFICSGFLSVLLCQNLKAQVFEPVFRNYTANDGLTSSQIYQIKQDSKGYVWFATDNGISRFDGNEFTNYSYANGLCVRILFGIYEDPFERIWFYSYSGALVYFDHKDKQMHCPEFNSELIELSQGNVLNGVFYHEENLITYDKNGNVYQINLETSSVEQKLSKEYFKLSFFKPNSAFLGFQVPKVDTLIRLQYSEHNRIVNQTENIPIPKNPKHLNSTVSYNENKDEFVFNVLDRIYLYRPKSNSIKIFSIPYNSTRSLLVDQNGFIWLGSFSDGVFAYCIENDKLVEKYHFLSNQMITSVMQDRDGGFWFSSQDNGAYYSPNIKAESFSSNLPSNLVLKSQVLVVKKTPNSVLFSNRIGQVARVYQQRTNELEILANEGLNFDKLFVGGDSYIRNVTCNGKSYSLRSYLKKKNKEYAIVLENKELKTLFKSGEECLIKEIKNYPDERFRKLQITENGNLYIGSNHRLLFYDAKTENWFEFKKNSNKYKSFEVTGIESVRGDSVWVSTRNRGILLLHGSDVLIELNCSNGFPIDYCNHVFIHKQDIFVSANEGILKVQNAYSDPKYTLLNKSSGLLSDDVIGSTVFKEHLYLATNDGLCRIDTQLFEKKDKPIHCRIEEVLIDSVTISTNEEFQIEQEEVLKIKFVTNAFSNAFSIPYRYRLKQNDKWSFTKDNSIQISNLGPASYQFEVQAADAYGNWGISDVIFFRVKPKFWETFWFTLASVVGTLFLVSIIFWFRLKQANKMNQLKSAMVNSQNKALSAQMNPHFIFNSLNSISHGLLNNNVRSSVLFIGKFGKLMRTIFENSEEAFITLDEELQALKTYLELEKLRLQEKLQYSIQIDLEIQGDQVYLPALLLQPFVENAIWHGIASLPEGEGFIEIKIELDKEFIVIKIEDNGIGFQQKGNQLKKEKSAIQIAKKRLELIRQIYKKKISFSVDFLNENALNKGTKIELQLPLITTKP